MFKRIVVGLVAISVLIGALSFNIPRVSAEGVSLSQVVEILIGLGIIPADKAAAARAVISSSVSSVTPVGQTPSTDLDSLQGSTSNWNNPTTKLSIDSYSSKTSYDLGVAPAANNISVSTKTGIAGTPANGFNVQAFVYKSETTAAIDGGNASFSDSSRTWNYAFKPITAPGTYRMEIVFYCGNTIGGCGLTDYKGDQVVKSFNFFVGSLTGETLQLVGTSTPTIQVLSPNGGETFKVGETATIRWSAMNAPAGSFVGLQLSYMRGGQRYEDVIGSRLTSGSYSWTVPSTYLENGTDLSSFKVRAILYNAGDSSIEDYGDRPFTIVASNTSLGPTISSFTLSASSVDLGQSVLVSGTASKGVVDLKRYRMYIVGSQGGAWTNVTSGSSVSLSSYLQTAKSPLSFYNGVGTYILRFEVEDVNGKTAAVERALTILSAVNNDVSKPAISLVSPDGGTYYPGGKFSVVINKVGTPTAGMYYFVYLKEKQDRVLGGTISNTYVPVWFREPAQGYTLSTVTLTKNLPVDMAAGSYYVEVDLADANGVPLSSSTSANRVIVSSQSMVQTGPSISSFSVSPSITVQGQPITWSGYATKGSAPIAKYRAYVVGSNNGQGSDWTTATNGDSVSFSGQVATDQNSRSFYNGTGTYTLRFEVQDKNDRVASAERTVTLTVPNGPAKPNLRITNIQFSPAQPKVNEWVTPTFTIYNASQVPVNTPFTVNSQGTLITVNSIGAYGQAFVSAPNNFTKSSAGSMDLNFIVDAMNTIDEDSESDNGYTASITFTAPEPVVTGPSITSFQITPTSLNRGESISWSGSATRGSSPITQYRAGIDGARNGEGPRWTAATNGDSVSFNASGISTAENPNSFFSGTNSYTVFFEVQDANGKTSRQNITVNVNPVTSMNTGSSNTASAFMSFDELLKAIKVLK